MLVYIIRFGRKSNLLYKRLVILMLTYLIVLYATSILIAPLNLYDEANFNVSKSADKKLKFILLWNAPQRIETLIFGSGHDSFVDHGCPVSDCYIVNSPYQYPERPLDSFDAIIFNFNDQFYRKMPSNESTIFSRRLQQRFIFFTQEPPPHINKILSGYRANYFNWTMSYRFDSDIQFLYGRIHPKATAPTSAPEVAIMIEETHHSYIRYNASNSRQVKPFKQHLAVAMISNCNTHGLREDYIKELKRYIPVDNYGKCDFNDESTVDDNWDPKIGLDYCKKSEFISSSPECYDVIETRYKFYLSFENSVCVDYVTEKFFHVMARNIVPVVYGGANYSRIAPPHSFIDARQFKPKQLAEYLLRLDQNEILYNEYFWWKKHYVVEAGEAQMARYGFCDLCRKLHHDNESKVYSPHMIYKWFSLKDQCVTKS